MAKVSYDKEITALLVIDPYNNFISEGGKVWDRLKTVAEANDCVPHMLQVLNAARKAELGVFYALHHRYRQGDYPGRCQYRRRLGVLWCFGSRWPRRSSLCTWGPVPQWPNPRLC